MRSGISAASFEQDILPIRTETYLLTTPSGEHNNEDKHEGRSMPSRDYDGDSSPLRPQITRTGGRRSRHGSTGCAAGPGAPRWPMTQSLLTQPSPSSKRIWARFAAISATVSSPSKAFPTATTPAALPVSCLLRKPNRGPASVAPCTTAAAARSPTATAGSTTKKPRCSPGTMALPARTAYASTSGLPLSTTTRSAPSWSGSTARVSLGRS